MIDEKTIIKNEKGEQVTMDEFGKLMETGEWGIDPIKNAEGNIEYLQLRKATKEEKKMMSEMTKKESPGDSKKIGETIPDFNIKDINGNEINSKNTEGKVVVLNFWFTTCKPCIAEIPELNEVYAKYNSNPNVIFASITFNSAEEVKEFVKKNNLDYPIVTDARSTCQLFDVSLYPTNMIIDAKGKIVQYLKGSFPNIGNVISESIQKELDKR